ncbi:MAG: hypothetical protein ACRDVZ_11475, partial [Jiangellaceae bacterium]
RNTYHHLAHAVADGRDLILKPRQPRPDTEPRMPSSGQTPDQTRPSANIEATTGTPPGSRTGATPRETPRDGPLTERSQAEPLIESPPAPSAEPTSTRLPERPHAA